MAGASPGGMTMQEAASFLRGVVDATYSNPSSRARATALVREWTPSFP